MGLRSVGRVDSNESRTGQVRRGGDWVVVVVVDVCAVLVFFFFFFLVDVFIIILMSYLYYFNQIVKNIASLILGVKR